MTRSGGGHVRVVYTLEDAYLCSACGSVTLLLVEDDVLFDGTVEEIIARDADRHAKDHYDREGFFPNVEPRPIKEGEARALRPFTRSDVS